MFTMGCVVNFVLFGDHPFGGKYFRIANIVKYNPEQLNRTGMKIVEIDNNVVITIVLL